MAIAFVKSGTRVVSSGGSSSVVSLNSVVAGNLVVCVTAVAQGGSNPGNIATPSGWTDAVSTNGANALQTYDSVCGIFYKENSAGGTETATISFPSDSWGHSIILEFSGLEASGALDVVDSNAATSQGTSSTTGSGVTNTQANALAICLFGGADDAGTASGLSVPAATGYTSASSVTVASVCMFDVGYKVLSATGSQVASLTWTTNGGWATALAIFKAAGGGLEVAATLGTATADGFTASIDQQAEISATLGTATADGFLAGVDLQAAITGALGTAAADGFLAGVDQQAGITATLGAAVADGFTAAIGFDVDVSATTGAAVADGFTAGVAAAYEVTATLGTATADGFSATVAAGYIVTATLGTAVADGFLATVDQQSEISALLGAAVADGFAATITTDFVVLATLGVAGASGYPVTISTPPGPPAVIVPPTTIAAPRTLAARGNKLHLTREQLGAFLKDHQSVRQFERLFSSVNEIAPDFVQEVSIEAGIASAQARQALDALERIADAVDLIAAMPQVVPPAAECHCLAPPLPGAGTQTPMAVGEAFATNVSITITVAAPDTPYEVGSGIAAGELRLMEFGGAHYLEVIRTGLYLLNWSMGVDSTNPNDQVEGGYMIDGAAQNNATAHTTVATGNAVSTMASTGLITLVQGEQVSLFIRNHTAARDVTVEHFALTLVQIQE